MKEEKKQTGEEKEGRGKEEGERKRGPGRCGSGGRHCPVH